MNPTEHPALVTEAGRPRARRRGPSGNPHVLLARAVAASGIFRLPLGRATLGEYLDKLLTVVLVTAARVSAPWHDTRLMDALRAIIPPAPLYRLALHSYEPETTRLFRRLLRPGMTVVDLGAEIGQYTLIAAMDVGPAGHVYAFEPNPHSLRVLGQNVRISGHEDVVTIEPMAVASGRGQTELFLGLGRGVTSMFRHPGCEEQSIVVETVSLDTYFGALGWPRVDVMKMDIDGAERLALGGMVELAHRNPHLKLIVEFCPESIRAAGGTPEQFFRVLRKVGFTRVWVASDKREPVQLPQDLPWLMQLAGESSLNLLCTGGQA